MLDGRRKSIQPMAARLDGVVHEQALNHFVTNSPWPVEPVRARIAGLVDEAVAPQAWAIDDTGLLKCGTASPCVSRQYTGTAGKVTNCQIAVSVSMYKIWNRMSSGTYLPPAVKAVEIPKPHGGGTRILDVPKVADRITAVGGHARHSPDEGE